MKGVAQPAEISPALQWPCRMAEIADNDGKRLGEYTAAEAARGVTPGTV